jgi:SMC interacting uncharacterized protein involved in chromosome segregation
MLENEYLELSNQLQESFNKKEKELESVKQDNDDLKKDLISAYGIVRVIDFYLASSEVDTEIKATVDLLRGFLSDKYDEIIG